MSEVLSRMWNRNSVNPQMNMTPGARRPRLSAKNGRKHLNMRNVERDKTPNFQIRVEIDLIASFLCFVGRSGHGIYLGSTLTRFRICQEFHTIFEPSEPFEP